MTCSAYCSHWKNDSLTCMVCKPVWSFNFSFLTELMGCNHSSICSISISYLLSCVLSVAGRASEVVEFVASLECGVLHTVLQLFDRRFDLLTSVNKTDEQKIPEMRLTSAEMIDKFKKIVVTSVNFILFSG